MTTAHFFTVDVTGWQQFQLYCSAATIQSGSVAFSIAAGSQPKSTDIVALSYMPAVSFASGATVQINDGTNNMGAMTNFGSTPGTVKALNANVSLFQGTAAISATNPLVTQVGDGTHTVTLNSTTYSSKYGLDVNLLGTLGTAFSTAGFVDIKGADGNVFVRQATAANLNATVVGTGTFAVQAAQSGTWTVGLTSGTGPIKVEGNAGGAFDAATNATPPANAVQIGCIAATALPSANTATDLTVPMTDKFGRTVVLPQAMRDLVAYVGTTITSSTSATNILTGISGVYTDICSLTITNSSSTATTLTLSDGTNSYPFSAGAGPGWGITIPFSPPIPATSANTNWTLQCGTSVASILVVVGYVKNK
jgi:hypothetical protein